MDLKVLWTNASNLGTFSDLKMLKKSRGFNIDFVTADRTDKDSIGFVIVGKKYIVPSGKDPNYIDSIMDICKKESINTVIPQYSDELVPLSRNMDLFKMLGIKVLVTEDTKMLSISNNKKKLYDFFKGKKYIPSYECVCDVDSLERAVKKLGYPEKSVCVKPVDGEGGKGFRIITNEKLNILSQPVASPKISFEAFKSQIEGLSSFPELIVLEYLPGREYSVDCICKEGEMVICIPRQRLETSMGVATVSYIEKNEELIEISKEIVSSLKLSYNINIQFKYSSSGQPKLIEVNPRVSGSLVANLGAGVNMLEQSLKIAYGLPIGKVKINWGMKMIRYWDQIFIKGSKL